MSNASLDHVNSKEFVDSISRFQYDMIDAELMYILRLVFIYIKQLLIQSFGIVTNILTITTFIKSGMTDSVSVCFLSLAVSDMGYLVVFLSIRIIGILYKVIKINTELPLSAMLYVISFYGVYFQDVSTFITLYTAIQKCCCVSLPHLFRNIFTTFRSWVCIAIIFIGTLAIYIPLFHSLGFRYQFLPVTNTTRLTYFARPYFNRVLNFWRIFSRIGLVISTQVILFVCLAIMANRFKQSAKFRDSFANDENKGRGPNEETGNKKSVKMGVKERRALAAVVWVSAMYMFSTIPYSLVYFVRLTYSPYSSKHFNNLRVLIFNCQSILAALSASLNFFVYLRYNSKFCLTFHAIFRLKTRVTSA